MGMRISQCNAQNECLQSEIENQKIEFQEKIQAKELRIEDLETQNKNIQEKLQLKMEDLETQNEKILEKFDGQEMQIKELLTKLQVKELVLSSTTN